MPVNKFSVSLTPDASEAIAKRGGERSTTLNQMVMRYNYMLALARSKLRETFSKEECALILDALNGSLFYEYSVGWVANSIKEAIQIDGLDKKWEVDGKGLVEKMQALNYWQCAALVDASETWWNRVANGEQPEFGELLQK